jgi:hypothetical protein
MDESSLFPGFGRSDDHDRTEKRTRGTRGKRSTQQHGKTTDRSATAGSAEATSADASSAKAATPAPECVAPSDVPPAHASPTPEAPAMKLSPDDCVAPTPFVPVTIVDHTHLAAHTFEHLEECPALGVTAAGYVEECLRSRRRFPHTLIVGPADSSKRTIARTIAAEMAAPVHLVEVSQLFGPDALHYALKDVPAGAVVIVGGLESACPEAMADLGSVMSGRRPMRERGMLDMMREIDGESWKRPARRPATPYADFTMILTSRDSVPMNSPVRRCAQLQYFTQRDAITERARLTRLFRHTGCQLDADVVTLLASVAVDSRIRTLQVANVMSTFIRHADHSAVLREKGKRSDSENTVLERAMFEALFASCIEPRQKTISLSSIACAEPPDAEEAA